MDLLIQNIDETNLIKTKKRRRTKVSKKIVEKKIHMFKLFY